MYSLFSLLLIYLANKRIVYLAVAIVVVLLLTVYKGNKENKIANRIVIGILLAAIVIYIYMIKTGIIQDIVNTYGINDQGRIKLYNYFNDDYNFSILSIGQGIGYVMKNIGGGQGVYWSRALKNLHNDWLHFLIEAGAIGALGYYFLSFRFLKNNISPPKKEFSYMFDNIYFFKLSYRQYSDLYQLYFCAIFYAFTI